MTTPSDRQRRSAIRAQYAVEEAEHAEAEDCLDADAVGSALAELASGREQRAPFTRRTRRRAD